jgi:hypothetical protein
MPTRVAFLHDDTITSCNFATKNVACRTICGVPRDLLYEDLLYANRTSMHRSLQPLRQFSVAHGLPCGLHVARVAAAAAAAAVMT